jgi:hypothetical protein
MQPDEIVGMVRAFAVGEIPLSDLRDWLEDHVQETADCTDAWTRDLSDQSWIAFSEVDAGLRDEASARSALAALLKARSYQRQSA